MSKILRLTIGDLIRIKNRIDQQFDKDNIPRNRMCAYYALAGCIAIKQEKSSLMRPRSEIIALPQVGSFFFQLKDSKGYLTYGHDANAGLMSEYHAWCLIGDLENQRFEVIDFTSQYYKENLILAAQGHPDHKAFLPYIAKMPPVVGGDPRKLVKAKPFSLSFSAVDHLSQDFLENVYRPLSVVYPHQKNKLPEFAEFILKMQAWAQRNFAIYTESEAEAWMR